MSQAHNQLRNIIVNADDFALSEPVNAAIISLAERGIINATSAMVLSPLWDNSAKKLRALPIQVGLHLDLTSDFARQQDCHYRLPRLIAAAYSRQLDAARLKTIIQRQWDSFCHAYGSPPDFIDGHQHVHQLPIVRDALFAVIVEQGWQLQPQHWLRSCRGYFWRGYKAKMIDLLGADRFHRKAHALGISTNTDFAGVYDFDEHANLKALWDGWLGRLHGDKPLIMCHIAQPDCPHEAVTDPIYSARTNEYRWLASEEFQQLVKSKSYLIKQ